MNTISEQWQSFSSVLPAGAGKIQRQEVRRAFYAGAKAVLNLSAVIADQSEDAGVQMLEGLHEECRRFFQHVQEGKA